MAGSKKRVEEQLEITFDRRFIDNYAGVLLSDTKTALVELVANAWDAGATEVEIRWPDHEHDTWLRISDNGHGMSERDFRKRFCALDYDRTKEQGSSVEFPDGQSLTRVAFGRNGKGRLAAFRFSDPFRVVTARDGIESEFLVSRGSGAHPLDVSLVSTKSSSSTGTTIEAQRNTRVELSCEGAREVVGMRFLADPSFSVKIDGTYVSFADIPEDFRERKKIPVDRHGFVEIMTIDSQQSDRTTKHHGVAWRVQNRLVGEITWKGSDEERILDGRTQLAKRLTFIVFADLLHEHACVLPDWSGFDARNPVWEAVNNAVQTEISSQLRELTREQRREVRDEVREQNRASVSRIGPASRQRWSRFVDAVLDSCSSISPKQLGELAGILAKLELAETKYDLLGRLHALEPGDLDSLNDVLQKWTVDAAKFVLDELEWRLKLITELQERTRDPDTLEVQELQPLMESCLWMFGPEYDVIDYTSNEGMTRVISMLTGNSLSSGSNLRPDFVITPGGSVGFYSYPRYDEESGEPVQGVSRLVIVELKRPGVPVGAKEKAQPWTYVKKLYDKGVLKKGRDPVQAWILGSTIGKNEEDSDTKAEGTVRLSPLTYEVFLDRAHGRTFRLLKRVKGTPFLEATSESDLGSLPEQVTFDLRSAS